jgi:hypothetical protein
VNVRLSLYVAILFGAITLFGYFLPLGIMPAIQAELIRTAVFLGVLAMILGAGNLILVHSRRSLSGKPGWSNSMVLIFSFILTFLLVLGLSLGAQNPFASDVFRFIVQYLQVPLEAGLSAVLAFVLLVAGARLLHRRMGGYSVLFLSASLLVLLAIVPLPLGLGDAVPGLNDLRALLGNFVMVIASGGGRGILIGMALGAAATGLRILLGIDRPYER